MNRTALAMCTALALAFLATNAAAGDRGVVDIDVVGADIGDVLRLIAEVGHVNVVYGNDVSGKVTLRLRRVRWQRALDVVLASKGLAAARQGNVVLVAPASAFARDRAARLDAHTLCVASAPLETRLIPVSYAEAAELAQQVRVRLTSRGSVSWDERTNTLIVTDVVGCGEEQR